MNKLFNYIRNGKGIGALFLLALSVIYVTVIAITFSLDSKEIIEKTQKVSEQLLPLKIENRVLVEPLNERREASFNIGEEKISFAVDSTVDSFDPSTLSQGIFLSRKNIYIVSSAQTKIEAYGENLTLPKGDYRDAITQFLYMIKWTVILVALVALFVMYLIFTLFYAFCAGILASILKKKMTFDAKMRLSALCFSAIVLISTILDIVGINLNWMIFFIFVLALQFLYLFKVSPEENQ